MTKNDRSAAVSAPTSNDATTLESLIREKQWKSTIKHLRKHRANAQISDSKGRLPLHLAALRDAPLDVIEALLSSHPDATHVRDDNGHLPLHCLFLSKRAPPYVEVVQRLVETNPSAARTRDDCGMLPLHYATSCGHDIHKDIFTMLMDAEPLGFFLQDNELNSPVDYAFRNEKIKGPFFESLLTRMFAVTMAANAASTKMLQLQKKVEEKSRKIEEMKKRNAAVVAAKESEMKEEIKKSRSIIRDLISNNEILNAKIERQYSDLEKVKEENAALKAKKESLAEENDKLLSDLVEARGKIRVFEEISTEIDEARKIPTLEGSRLMEVSEIMNSNNNTDNSNHNDNDHLQDTHGTNNFDDGHSFTISNIEQDLQRLKDKHLNNNNPNNPTHHNNHNIEQELQKEKETNHNLLTNNQSLLDNNRHLLLDIVKISSQLKEHKSNHDILEREFERVRSELGAEKCRSLEQMECNEKMKRELEEAKKDLAEERGKFRARVDSVREFLKSFE